MITVGSRRALHVLFNGVKRDDKASVLVDKKSTPNGHSLNIVVLDLGAFLKKDPNFVSERTFGQSRRTTRFADRVEAEELGLPLPLLASFDDRNRHGWPQSSLSLSLVLFFGPSFRFLKPYSSFGALEREKERRERERGVSVDGLFWVLTDFWSLLWRVGKLFVLFVGESFFPAQFFEYFLGGVHFT